MRLGKTILQSEGTRRLLCRLVAGYIRLVRLTGRWTVVRGENPRAFWQAGKPFIGCFWHGRLLMMPCAWTRGNPIHVLISEHRDGRLIAETIAHFDLNTVAGSTRRGGVDAIRTLLKVLRSKEYACITPDGPRGPRMRASDGIVRLARVSGVPILPATFSARRRTVLSSWDRFVIPWPFTRGVLVWGEPITVARDADDAAVERARRQVEDALNALTEEADRLVGQSPIEPAAIAGQARS